MANMMDYLLWRGDVTIGQSPWNDVDSLIAATLSYQTYPAEPIALHEAAATLPPPPAIQFNFIKESRALLSAAGMTERFADLTLRLYGMSGRHQRNGTVPMQDITVQTVAEENGNIKIHV